jgi:glucans biosynthesis protein
VGEKPTSSVARTDLDAGDDCGGVRPDIMAMCLRLLAMYMQQLMLDGDDAPPSSAGAAVAAGGRRARSPVPPADNCGARLRDGSPCRRPPVEGRRRCRSHGCAPRAGAPKGNRNALKHGCFTAKEIAKGRRISEFIRECRETMQAARRGR